MESLKNLSRDFENNVMDDTKRFSLLIKTEDKQRMQGLPASYLQQRAAAARQRFEEKPEGKSLHHATSTRLLIL